LDFLFVRFLGQNYLKYTLDIGSCQILDSFGYNDTAHFKLRRCDYFKKIDSLDGLRRRSKMRVKKKMFSILKEKTYLYIHPTKIILRAKGMGEAKGDDAIIKVFDRKIFDFVGR